MDPCPTATGIDCSASGSFAAKSISCGREASSFLAVTRKTSSEKPADSTLPTQRFSTGRPCTHRRARGTNVQHASNGFSPKGRRSLQKWPGRQRTMRRLVPDDARRCDRPSSRSGRSKSTRGCTCGDLDRRPLPARTGKTSICSNDPGQGSGTSPPRGRLIRPYCRPQAQ